MSPAIRKQAKLVSELVPAVRVADLRRLAGPGAVRRDGTIRVTVEAPAGPQRFVLVPEWRPYGNRYLAICGCGRKMRLLRLDQSTGCWKCGKCLGLRSARSRFRDSRVFREVVLPLMDLDRLRQRMAHPWSRRSKREAFAVIERETVQEVLRTLASCKRSGARSTTAAAVGINLPRVDESGPGS